MLKFEIGLLRSVRLVAHKQCKGKVFRNADKSSYRRITKKKILILLCEENKAAAVHIAEDN